VIPTTAGAAPFLKWAGGKRRLLPALLPHVPPSFNVYREPFVGGGALYFALRPTGGAVLSDANARLVRTYRAVRDDVEGVIETLQRMPASPEYYGTVRGFPVDELRDVDLAAWMLYVNRHGFNGLYRVNRAGQFNVPYGGNGPIDPAVLHAASLALQGTTINAGDFCYCDPPYVPVTKTASFTGYCPGGFGYAEQLRLRDAARRAVARGVHVVCSNSDTPTTRELYWDFRLYEVTARRSVAANGAKRGHANELIIVGAP